MERNITSLIGYGLQATDGEIGEVVDFYFDDETWTIRYLENLAHTLYHRQNRRMAIWS